ncbi:hypothetical protein IHE45_17G101900 [Dioscorea alata]|uniref:Uncharacterized protein n=1 Tax=Dioscorea alata TaxID=55571 RepID=A0ACB7UEF7_DIOAL|nr:hypothetical protein IHE45_17G101900 [Dioscorea alata]
MAIIKLSNIISTLILFTLLSCSVVSDPLKCVNYPCLPPPTLPENCPPPPASVYWYPPPPPLLPSFLQHFVIYLSPPPPPNPILPYFPWYYLSSPSSSASFPSSCPARASLTLLLAVILCSF